MQLKNLLGKLRKFIQKKIRFNLQKKNELSTNKHLSLSVIYLLCYTYGAIYIYRHKDDLSATLLNIYKSVVDFKILMGTLSIIINSDYWFGSISFGIKLFKLARLVQGIMLMKMFPRNT